MALLKWRSPGEELTRMERRMRQLFAEPFRMDVFAEDMVWSPPVEVTEADDEFLVTAELPGMAKDDVEVDLENNVLSIRGEKREEKEEKEKEKERYLYERYYGSFQRSFTLPKAVDESKVSAEFRNGVLTIRLPKGEQARGRRVAITG